MKHLMATVHVNTEIKTIFYRSFVINEVIADDRGNCWEWAHENFGRKGELHNDVWGLSRSIFDAILTVEAWHRVQA